MRRDRSPKAPPHLLEVLVRRPPAEDLALRVLVLSPRSRQHRGRIVVITFRGGALTARRTEVALLNATLRHGHAGHGPVGAAAPGDDVGPVDPVLLAVEPHPALRD